MELLVGALLAAGNAGLGKLTVELPVHYSEYDEVEQAYAEQRSTESERSKYGAAEGLADDGSYPHHREDAQTGYGHLKTHCKSHFLALEPLGKHLGHIGALHLTAAAENHKAQRGHLGACRHLHPPAVEPAGKGRSLEPLADAHELDGGAQHHQTG